MKGHAVSRNRLRKMPTPARWGHEFNNEDPEPLRKELARLRREEWKHASVCDGRGAAEAACTRMALLRGWDLAIEAIREEDEQ